MTRWITKKGKDGKNRHIPIQEGYQKKEKEIKTNQKTKKPSDEEIKEMIRKLNEEIMGYTSVLSEFNDKFYPEVKKLENIYYAGDVTVYDELEEYYNKIDDFYDNVLDEIGKKLDKFRNRLEKYSFKKVQEDEDTVIYSRGNFEIYIYYPSYDEFRSYGFEAPEEAIVEYKD